MANDERTYFNFRIERGIFKPNLSLSSNWLFIEMSWTLKRQAFNVNDQRTCQYSNQKIIIMYKSLQK